MSYCIAVNIKSILDLERIVLVIDLGKGDIDHKLAVKCDVIKGTVIESSTYSAVVEVVRYSTRLIAAEIAVNSPV